MRVFVDTNILIYAHDLDAGPKRDRAARALKSVWESGSGIVSTQVLQEFYVNVTHKIPSPLPRAVARTLVTTYGTWSLVMPTLDTVLQASEIEERHQLSFWDAMIVAAAAEGGADTIWSEDLSHGQVIEGIQIENPLLE